MSMKVHVFIGVVIMLVVLAAGTAFMATQPEGNLKSEQPSGKSIEISRADWGLNCLSSQYAGSPSSPRPTAVGSYANQQGASALHSNNVLQLIQTACQNRSRCALSNRQDFLGEDPVPSCPKTLVVEYRCFAYDRPWRLELQPDQTGLIDCTTQAGP